MERNILLTIAYDGSGFSGWQRQPGQRTVQGELERALSLLTGTEVTLEGAGRTDAGVHALGQRASFSGEFGIPTDRIPVAANAILAGQGPFAMGDVRIRKAEEVPMGFHARFDALGKTYRYCIRNANEPDIMARRQSYYLKTQLDLKAMQEAAQSLVGEHDFRAFMAAGGKEMQTTVRRIDRVDLWSEPINGKDREIILEITGNGFLYNMVRIITGTLVDIGTGRIPSDEMPAILGGLDRRNAGHTAPPHGLYLKEVYYKEV